MSIIDDNYDPQTIQVGDASVWFTRDGALAMGTNSPYRIDTPKEQPTRPIWHMTDPALRFDKRASALAFATALRAMAEEMK